MTFEIDHIFILTDIGAGAAEQLISLGFVEGSSNVHPGQGTANRRFFFNNVGLELLWADNEADATSAPIRQTHLWERWKNRKDSACPFGVCLRPTVLNKGVPNKAVPNSNTVSSSSSMPPFSPLSPSFSPPFSYWHFQPPYLPKTLSIAVATNSENIAEPMLFQTPFAKRPDQFSGKKSQPLEHPIGVTDITQVTLTLPSVSAISPELAALAPVESLQLRSGPAHCMTITFDHHRQRQQHDCRPDLPLILKW